jgi:hypothetical protein
MRDVRRRVLQPTEGAKRRQFPQVLTLFRKFIPAPCNGYLILETAESGEILLNPEREPWR